MRNRKYRAFLVGPVATPLARLLGRQGFDPDADTLIAVDGGLDACARAGLAPDLAIGDWDSVRKPGRVALVPHITLPRDKDRSDLYFAIAATVEAGATELQCFGLTGGAPDHQLGVLYELMEIARDLVAVSAHDEHWDYHFVTPAQSPWRAHPPKGARVSIFPVAGAARGVSLKGFEYPLRNAVLESTSRGLSNTVKSQPIEIKLTRGALVALIAHE